MSLVHIQSAQEMLVKEKSLSLSVRRVSESMWGVAGGGPVPSPELKTRPSQAYSFQQRTYLFDDLESMKKYQPRKQDLFEVQTCRGNSLCGVDLRNAYMSWYFSKYRSAPLLTQSAIGPYNDDACEIGGSDALKLAASLISPQAFQTAPVLWMPSRPSALLDDFESYWNEVHSYLFPAVVCLLISLLPLFTFGLLAVCTPIMPSSCRRSVRKHRARVFDRQDMFAAMRLHVNPSHADRFSIVSVDHSHFPSCTWRGYYKQYGSDHNLCSYTLSFHQTVDGEFVIDGGGQDDVGTYVIDGEWNPMSRRIAFVKEYDLGSATIHGRVDWRENKGHRVLYKGVALPTPGQGFKGTWSLEVTSFRDQGEFRLWPEELPALSATWFHMQAPSAPPLEQDVSIQSRAPHIRVYDATPDGICVVCLERSIGVALAPCGHIAACAQCASRLPSGNCPICRQFVQHVIPCNQAVAS